MDRSAAPGTEARRYRRERHGGPAYRRERGGGPAREAPQVGRGAKKKEHVGSSPACSFVQEEEDWLCVHYIPRHPDRQESSDGSRFFRLRGRFFCKRLWLCVLRAQSVRAFRAAPGLRGRKRNASGRTRTCNPRFRRPMLCPIELRTRRVCDLICPPPGCPARFFTERAGGRGRGPVRRRCPWPPAGRVRPIRAGRAGCAASRPRPARGRSRR